jgi:hypothetical protein
MYRRSPEGPSVNDLLIGKSNEEKSCAWLQFARVLEASNNVSKSDAVQYYMLAQRYNPDLIIT